MGSLDEALSAMLSTDHGYPSSLASVLPVSNAANTGGLQVDFFTSQYSSLQSGSLQGSFAGPGLTGGVAKPKSSSNFQRTGGLQGNRPSAPSYRNAAEASQWPFGRDQKFVLDGNNEALEVTSGRNFNAPPPGGLQRYHSEPSSVLQSWADATEDAFAQGPEDDDLLDSFFTDNSLAPINERGAHQMANTGTVVVDAASSTSMNDYEQFLASADFHSASALSPSAHLPSKFAELGALPGHGAHSTPEALGVRSRPSRINLLRQSSTPADFLAAVQDTLEPDCSSLIFKMPFLQSPDGANSNLSGVTSEADNAGMSGPRLPGASEMVMDPPLGWLGNSSLCVRAPDPSSPQSKLGLIRHSSLPARSRPFSPTLELEELGDFSGTVPCKTRANRGFATHPRSIAERVRRTKISERMKKLQDLVPNMDRQTNTADMLDEAVEYVKHLQTQVQELSNTVLQLKERLGHTN